MTSRSRNRLLLLGAFWGLALAALPAFVMSSPFRPTGFLLAALAFAALGGAIGAAVAGKRALGRVPVEDGVRSWLVSGIKTGAMQGLVGGTIAALLIWA